MSTNFSFLLYLVSAVFFIFSLRGLSSAKTAQKGNLFGMIGMGIAIAVTLFHPSVYRYFTIFVGILLGGAIGIYFAKRIKMTSLPQLIAAFHSLVGLSAVCVSAAAFCSPQVFHIGIPGNIPLGSLLEMGIGTIVGAITFTGSVVAFFKLQGQLKTIVHPKRHLLHAFLLGCIGISLLLCIFTQSLVFFALMTLLSFVLGGLLVLPIGGADMPVIVSMLNSYSGWAAAGIGLTLGNHLLIITGALVGSSGAILSYIMCKGMNRSIINVILGGFGSEAAKEESTKVTLPIQEGHPDDAAYIMKNAGSLIIVPGYGMAVAQAQHGLKEMADLLNAAGVRVRYAIHPVAGRMPGHMNVLLAEANVPYDDVLELEDINHDFASTDVAFVIGANDITNPAALNDPSSPIYGMPILAVEKAKTVFFVKRSLASGYAGIDNELFYRPNVLMVLGDAKKVCEDIIKALKHN